MTRNASSNLLLILRLFSTCTAFTLSPKSLWELSPTKSSCLLAKFTNDAGDQATEAMHSMVDFHEGRWRGKARSFTVTPDVAAGIINRKESPQYELSVKLGLDLEKRDYTITETIKSEDGTVLSPRKIYLSSSNVDIDSVDASYSLDTTLPTFPSLISGSDKLVQFMIEHCIATSGDERVRSFVLYGADQQLLRIVVCQEQRLPDEPTVPDTAASTTLTTQDLIEMQGDIDRLVHKIAGRINGSNNNNGYVRDSPSKSSSLLEDLKQVAEGKQSSVSDLSLHTTSLLEISSGIWLGDAVIREVRVMPTVLTGQRRGFADLKTSQASTNDKRNDFANWSVGVQKVAWRWMWNFGDEIRQVIDAGRSMGSVMDSALSKSLSGSVCVNEGLSRRIPPSERMVYLDWSGDNVGFLLGPAFIQVPRYLHFDRTREIRPFYTEFCVFQKTRGEAVSNEAKPEEPQLPKLVCSKISRVYSAEGSLKQGCTSFFSFQRFGTEKEDML